MRLFVATLALCAAVASGLAFTTKSLTDSIASSKAQAKDWGESLDLPESNQAFYELFSGIRQSVPLGLRGVPFYLKNEELKDICSSSFAGFYTFADLAQSIEDDFLDAGRGTTNNRKGWKMTTVGSPRGSSYEEAKMTLDEVNEALEKGTVIFNSAGAHIPALAGATLAAVEATCLPNALNMYVTAPQQRTSAPPHTDKQDVVVVQTSGSKHWRIFSPPDPSLKPSADMFARGKGSDNLPLFALEDYGCKLLLETDVNEGDVLFIPAGFPHTTDTSRDGQDDTSIHLTFGIDTRIWQLDYVCLRRLALQRANVKDPVLADLEDNNYVGAVNELPASLREDLMESLPEGYDILEDESEREKFVDEVCSKVQEIAAQVDKESASTVDASVWRETTERVLEHGKEICEIHRDMYLAAIEEGRLRASEAAMTAHLKKDAHHAMTPESIQRLSVFRVKGFMDQMEECTKSLQEWANAGRKSASRSGSGEKAALPDDWAFTLPVNVGDQVEADLGGAFFPAVVVKSAGGLYDVQYFDGDQDMGLERSQIKLLEPPAQEEEVDTSSMTPKQLKRWKKQQQKKQKLQ